MLAVAPCPALALKTAAARDAEASSAQRNTLHGRQRMGPSPQGKQRPQTVVRCLLTAGCLDGLSFCRCGHFFGVAISAALLRIRHARRVSGGESPGR